MTHHRLFILPVALLVAACGSSVMSNNEQPTGPSAPRGASIAAPQAPADAASKGSQTRTVVPIGVTQGHIERNVDATYTVGVGNFLTDFSAVAQRATDLSGFVVSSTTSSDDSGHIVSGSITVKVPQDQLTKFLGMMPSDFQTSSINFSSVDHTSQFVDSSARLSAANAHLQALNRLLANATDLGQITALENEISTVQQEIDTTQGELNEVNAQVAMSTATIGLRERGTAAPVPLSPIVSGAQTGWNNAVAIVSAAVVGAVTALPFLVIVLIAFVAYWLASRQQRILRRKASA